MVRHIYYYGILLAELVNDGIHDAVVIEYSVVIVGEDGTLLVAEFRPALLVSVLVESLLHLRTACSVVHVLSFQMEDDELRLVLALVFQLLVVTE